MAKGETILHGTAAAIRDAAVFLRGPSGSGKSDLAFRLVEGHGARLIADDQVVLTPRHGKVYASAPENIAGMMEVRGVGLVKYAESHGLPLRLVVDLVPRAEVPRLPPEVDEAEICGIAVPRLSLHAFDCSAALKVLKAMAIAGNRGLLVE